MLHMAHRVVVVGGGFGGLQAALKLSRQNVEVTLVDRNNFHLFQPLAYQVATGALSAAEICYPLRRIFHDRVNVEVLLAEVTDVDLQNRRLTLANVVSDAELPPLEYDTLIVSGGAQYSYFGHDEWQENAAELKSLEGGLSLRRSILAAFEAAELEPDERRRGAELTFAVVGAGPTGVEMAGQIAEIARDLGGDMRAYDPRKARILLIEATDRVLGSFPASLSKRAQHSLEGLGVTPRLKESVVDLGRGYVSVKREDGTTDRIETDTIIWAAGVTASPLAKLLADRAGVEVDKAGRLAVEPDLTVPGHPDVMAIGDMVSVRQPDGSVRVFPGVAPVAMQQGRHAARNVAARNRGEPYKAFRYIDKGNLATIGRGRAVADIKHLHLWGFPAWAIWLGIHIWYLIGFENRVLVMIRWAFSFLGHGRSARLIQGRV
jgi:NADH dehydrogenase